MGILTYKNGNLNTFLKYLFSTLTFSVVIISYLGTKNFKLES